MTGAQPPYSLVELPVGLLGCRGLMGIMVSSRHIKSLPDWLGQLSSLRVLNLKGCSGLKALPESIARLTALQNLNLSNSACCFETLGERSEAFTPCGHTYCNRACCLSAQAVECPECRQAVAGRVVLFGALANVEAALAAGGAMAV